MLDTIRNVRTEWSAMTTDPPHPCSFPPATLGRCISCGDDYVRRDEGPQAAGFCGASCQYASIHPDIDPADRQDIEDAWRDRK